jgi:AcrR family transcriptional regulator
VFNHFKTKEALVLDRLEVTKASLSEGLSSPDRAPIDAALHLLDQELGGMTDLLAAADDPSAVGTAIRRFGELIRATPSLRAYQSDMMDQFVAVADSVLAVRLGRNREDPEPQIAARSLLGLWHVQAQSLRTHLAVTTDPGRIRRQVTADVRRAARVVSGGLDSLELLVPAEPTPSGPSVKSVR